MAMLIVLLASIAGAGLVVGVLSAIAYALCMPNSLEPNQSTLGVILVGCMTGGFWTFAAAGGFTVILAAVWAVCP